MFILLEVTVKYDKGSGDELLVFLIIQVIYFNSLAIKVMNDTS